jgi:death-on-curing protein
MCRGCSSGRPIDQYRFEAVRDLASLAAAYGFGIARNPAFVDANGRAAFLAIGVFLAINGRRLDARQVEGVHTILALAAGTLDERQLADWIRANSRDSSRDETW